MPQRKKKICAARPRWPILHGVGLALATSGRINVVVVVVVVVGVVVVMGRSGLRLPPGALAGACRTSALRAVPHCLVGLVGRPWRRGLVDGALRVVVTVGGGGCRMYVPPAVLSDLSPTFLGCPALLGSSTVSSLASTSESSSREATSLPLASDAASLMPVRWVTFVVRARLAAEAVA